MSYFPLDRDIITSSLWPEAPAVLKVFLYMLLTADAEGEVHDTLPALAMRCGLPLEAARAATELLEGPDPHSRSQRKSGRRIERTENGWRVVNWSKYRNRDYSTPRWRRWYERQKSNGTALDPTVPNQGKREKGKGKRKGGEAPAPPAADAPPAPPPRFPLHCPDHQNVEFPPRCGQCKDRRVLAESTGGNGHKPEPPPRPRVDCAECQGTGYRTVLVMFRGEQQRAEEVCPCRTVKGE